MTNWVFKLSFIHVKKKKRENKYRKIREGRRKRLIRPIFINKDKRR